MTIYRDETDRTPAVNDRICVDLAERSYEVVVQDGLLDRIGEFLVPFKLGPDTVVVTNPVVKRHYGARVVRSLKAVGLKPTVLALPDASGPSRLGGSHGSSTNSSGAVTSARLGWLRWAGASLETWPGSPRRFT